MAENMILDGGIMIATAAPAVQQIVYLDFDGELTSYNGEILTIDHVAVEDSGLNTEDISAIADKLNEDFADRGVIFVTERPADGEFSTIYIGKTSAFEKYGNFAGLAETIDTENLNKSDNAFVMLKGNESATAIADTIAHEVEHIVFGMTHTGSGLAAYAEDEKNPGYIYYYYSTNHTFSGALNGGITLSHYSSNRTYTGSSYRTDGGDDYVCIGSRYDSAFNVTINSRGSMHISSGVAANHTTVNSCGYMWIFSGGEANHTTLNSGGDLWISSGGVANDIVISSGGCVASGYVASWRQTGEVAATITQMTGLGITGVATNLNGSGTIRISSGGVANYTTLNSGGSMYISSGGEANSTTLNFGGRMYIYSGGVVNDIVISSGGRIHNDSNRTPRLYQWTQCGEIAASITQISGNNLWGITGIATNLNGSGYFYIASGGVANYTTMPPGIYGGTIRISSGGVANYTTNSGGSMYISSGGEANSTTLNYGGSMVIYSGGVANYTTMSGGSIYISSGGVANYTTLNSGGSIHISSGVEANHTTVNLGGVLYISSGGVANYTTMSGGYMHISSGGVANSTILNSGGSMVISSGGTANSTTVNSGGRMYISSGRTALEIIENGGYVGVYEGAEVTFAANTFSGLELTSQSATVHSGTTAVAATLNSGGRMYIYGGGVANSTTVNSGGSMYISSGGVANDILISSGGYVAETIGYGWRQTGEEAATITQMSGKWITGIATKLNGTGTIRISSGGVANDTTLNSDGSMGIEGGVANSTTVSGGYMWIYSGGVANSTMMSGGTIRISSGGVANHTTVNSGGDLDIGYSSGGGTANHTTVNSGGSMTISSGGVANDIVISSGGYVASWTQTGEVAATITQMKGSGITGVATNLNGSGTIRISSGGVANSTTLNSGSMRISSDGVANSTTVNSYGYLYISSGGVANSTILNSGGKTFISSGGVANSTTVNSRGRMVIYSGGILSGTTLLGGQMICSGTVDATDAEIIFAVDQRTTTDAAIISNLANISGGNYTIQVDPTVNAGIYKLATSASASSFTKTITVKTATDTIGDFVWNEVTGAYNTVANGDTVYSLQKQNGALNLLITSPIDVVWEMKEIGQPGFYTGAYGMGTDPAATYVAIPFLYSFSVSFDKELADGYYDFAFTLDGTDQTIVRTIQIVNGVAAYVDQLNQQTVASTSCSETADTYTYTFTDIADTILTESLTETISVSASYTGANHAYAVSGGANVSGTTTTTGTLVNTRPHYDADKREGGGIEYLIEVDGFLWNTKYAFRLSYSQTACYVEIIKIGLLASSEKTSAIVNSSGLVTTYTFDGFTIEMDLGKTDDANTAGIDERLSISCTTTDPVKTLFSKIASYSFVLEDIEHCWIATAVNMMVAGGWLDTNNAQGVFESLSDKYYKENEKSTGGFPDQVFYDTIFHNWGNNNVGIKNNIEYSLMFTGNKIEGGFSFLDANEDRATAGLSFVICDGAGKKTAARHIFTVYKINKKSNTEWELICTDSDTENASGGDKEVRHVEKINGEWCLFGMPGQNNRKLIVEKFFILLNRAANIDPVSIRDWEYHSYDGKNVHAVKYGNFSTNEDGSVSIGAEGYMEEGIIGSEEKVIAETDSSINGVYLQNNASLLLKSGSEITGDIEISGGSVSMEKGVKTEDANIIFYLTDCEGENSVQLLDRIDYAAGAAFEIVVNSSQQTGRYLLAAGAENFDTEISVRGTGDYMRESDPGFNSGVLGTVSIDSALETYSRSYALTVADGKLYLDVETLIPLQLQSDTEGVAWVEASREDEYVVQYSRDEFEHAIEITVKGNRLDSLQLSDGSWQWRVRAKNNNNWNDGSWIIADTPASKYIVVKSNADGIDDVFFARKNGVWRTAYQATHRGILNGWQGTGDSVGLSGKNKIADIFEGSTDANVLLLTDGENGDALFADDIFSAAQDNLNLTQARIANLDEIRAGAGDDVVDMTSQRFDYVGDGVTIYGGDGDDVIWSNKGDNKLFGDAGNDHIVGASGNDVIVGGAGDDRMHGGGGDDIFCFGSDWGIDSVDQLSDGTVTLWFEDGSEENWNADARTYTDGENTVTVSGTADVTLKFGGDVSSLPEGIFSNAVTKKIFESTLA